MLISTNVSDMEKNDKKIENVEVYRVDDVNRNASMKSQQSPIYMNVTNDDNVCCSENAKKHYAILCKFLDRSHFKMLPIVKLPPLSLD